MLQLLRLGHSDWRLRLREFDEHGRTPLDANLRAEQQTACMDNVFVQAVQSSDARTRFLCKGCIGCVCPGQKGVKVGVQYMFHTLTVAYCARVESWMSHCCKPLMNAYRLRRLRCLFFCRTEMYRIIRFDIRLNTNIQLFEYEYDWRKISGSSP